MDHELRALMHVLRHNLRIIGSPLESPNSWSTSAFENYDYLSEHLISFVDPIGNTYLMPCQNPRHQEHGNNVYDNEYQHHIKKHKHKRRTEAEINILESEMLDDHH